ncbi:hypothetical protein DV738_g2097, partial [Chaetothyriales sp. CBS 135597]
MALRLPHSPATSAVPLAVARLDNFQWIICEAGYANVVKVVDVDVDVDRHDIIPSATSPSSAAHPHQSTVYGILYAMHPADEAALDRYEGHTPDRNPHPEPNYRPFLQGTWVYNKHYLRVHVVKWLVGNGDNGNGRRGVHVESRGQGGEDDDVVRALVYVDEVRTQPGRINTEYIGRMNRAIDESTALGLPVDWVDAVIRPHVQPGVEVPDRNYVGRVDKVED